MSASDDDRLRLFHPLHGGGRIWTEPVTEFCRQVLWLLAAGGESRCFDAVPDSGKSTAIAMAEGKIHEKFPWLPIYVVSVSNHRANAIREFFSYWVGILYNMKGQSDMNKGTLLRRVSARMVEDATASESSIVLVFIDEAQNLVMSDLLMLKDLHNDLDRSGIRMITVSVGQRPFMERSINNALSQDRKDVVKRFLDFRRGFRDLSVDGDESGCELEKLLQSIDEALDQQKPPQTWTQFFVPNAWTRGWRLKGEITNLVLAFEHGGYLARVKGDRTIPVGIAMKAIREYLTAAGTLDEHGEWPPSGPAEKQKCWTQVILPIGGERTNGNKREG